MHVERRAVNLAADSESPLLDELLQFGREANIRELCLPRSLNAETLDQLDAVAGRKRWLLKGEALFRQGFGLHAVYVVISGIIRTTVNDGDGRAQITGFYFPSELLGLDAWHAREHVCTATAITATVAHVIPIHRLDEVSAKVPAVFKALARVLSKSVAEHEELLLVVNQRTAVDRVAILLFSLACRFGRQGRPVLKIPMTIPRGDIANYLGLAKETVSRALAELQSMGVVAGRGRSVQIADMQRLTRLVVKGNSPSDPDDRMP